MDLFFDVTIGVGTTLVGANPGELSSSYDQTGTYMVVSRDVIYEYESRIAELRREVLYYRRMVARLIPSGSPSDEYEPHPVIPLDSASTRVINSIIQARIPPEATFRDFEEGEL
jgi:hypothetical protein